MSEEVEREQAEATGQVSAQMKSEDEGGEGEQEPPVLPVSQQPSLPTPQPRPDHDPSPPRTTSSATQTEEPLRGVQKNWDLEEMIDKWQVSAMPEEKQYFSMDPNLIAAAASAVKSRLTEQDGDIRGTWLITEIDHWDLEKERLLLLTTKHLLSVRYNFIQSVIEELKFIPLSAITNIVYGDFKYPSSYVYARKGKALKIFWGKEEGVGFFDRWNPFSSKVPYTLFASHLMLRRGKVDKDQLRISKVVPLLEEAINELRRAQFSQQQSEASSSAVSSSVPEDYHVKEEDIVIDSYVGLSALVHNDSNLGFFKRRGLLNW